MKIPPKPPPELKQCPKCHAPKARITMNRQSVTGSAFAYCRWCKSFLVYFRKDYIDTSGDEGNVLPCVWTATNKRLGHRK